MELTLYRRGRDLVSVAGDAPGPVSGRGLGAAYPGGDRDGISKQQHRSLIMATKIP